MGCFYHPEPGIPESFLHLRPISFQYLIIRRYQHGYVRDRCFRKDMHVVYFFLGEEFSARQLWPKSFPDPSSRHFEIGGEFHPRKTRKTQKRKRGFGVFRVFRGQTLEATGAWAACILPRRSSRPSRSSRFN
jgi:hypothetical protein